MKLRNFLPYLLTLAVLCAAVLLFIAFPSHAQTAGGAPGSEGNIVPCGNTPSTMCTLCDLYVLVRRVTNYLLFAFALPVAVIALLIGGILLLTSGGSPDKIKRGHAAIYNAVLGLILAFAAWLLINTVAQTFLFRVPFTTGIKQWFDIPICQAPIISAGPAESDPNQGHCVDAQGNSITNCQIVSRTACEGDGGILTKKTPKNCETGYCVDAQGNSINNCQTITRPACEGDGGIFQPDRPPSCGIVGTCQTTSDSNPHCSPAALQSTCFSSVATQASQICFGESGGRFDDAGDKKLTVTKDPVSIGLFQINLTQHTVAGINCPSAFSSPVNGNCTAGKQCTCNASNPCTITVPSTYQACVAAAQDPKTNVTTACGIYQNAGNKWSKDWQAIADSCHLP